VKRYALAEPSAISMLVHSGRCAFMVASLLGKSPWAQAARIKAALEATRVRFTAAPSLSALDFADI